MATFGGERGAGLSVEFYSGLLSRGGCGYSAFFVGKGGKGWWVWGNHLVSEEIRTPFFI